MKFALGRSTMGKEKEKREGEGKEGRGGKEGERQGKRREEKEGKGERTEHKRHVQLLTQREEVFGCVTHLSSSISAFHVTIKENEDAPHHSPKPTAP